MILSKKHFTFHAIIFFISINIFIVLFFINLFSEELGDSNYDLRSNYFYNIEEESNGILKITDKESGRVKYVKDIKSQTIPSESAIDMQFFDLPNISDSLFINKYKQKSILKISAALGSNIIIGDFNNNGKLDFLGSYKVEQNTLPNDIAVFELQSDTTFELKKIYQDSVVRALAVTDLDDDGLLEFNLMIEYNNYFANFESENSMSYPKDSINFKFELGQGSSEAGSETFVDLDNDGFMDLINTGEDTLPPKGVKIMVSEYDKELNCFVRRFKYQPYHWYVPRFCYGDFDQDNFMEFVGGSIDGDVHVFENTGDNSYEYIFKDTLSTPNAYLLCATNDIDNNGKPEFFVGGSSYYQGIGGTKVYWFEADGDNNYIKVRTFFLLGTDVLGTTELNNYDVNGDGKDDLVFAFGFCVVILVWNPSGYFDLYYYKKLENLNQEITSVNVYDTFSNGYPDLYVSFKDIEEEPRKFTILYLNRMVTNIDPPDSKIPSEFKLMQNYPNPFNASTNISFNLPKSEHVLLEVFNTLGQKITTLIDKNIKAGFYTTHFEGNNLSSGIYLYRIQTSSYTDVKKMFLLK